MIEGGAPARKTDPKPTVKKDPDTPRKTNYPDKGKPRPDNRGGKANINLLAVDPSGEDPEYQEGAG